MCGVVVAASVLAVATAQQAQASGSVSTIQTPHITSPTIGFVYGAGITDSGPGITVYAQHADGSLSKVQDVLDGDSVHATVLVHLKSGMALYDLTRNSINAFHINSANGKLTAFSVPTPASPVSQANGLGVYDPLGHGLRGQPMLVTGACGGPTTDLNCPFRYQVFSVNPVTGMLDAGSLGAVSTVSVQTGIVSDGLGRFAFGATTAGYTTSVEFARAVVSGTTTTLASAGDRIPADNATGQPSQQQSMGTNLIITAAGMVDFPVYPLYIFPDHPQGWVAYAFGATTGAPFESRISADVSASAQGVKSVFVGESGGNLPAGQCAVEAFGPGNPGLGGTRTMLPCTGAIANYINSMYEQGGFMYVALYGNKSLGFRDSGGASLTPTAQKTIPNGFQIYSWTGFLVSKPTVTVPATLSLKTGIPLTIHCPASCKTSISATVKIGASKTFLKTGTINTAPHAPGTFTVKLGLSTSLHAAIAAGVKKHQKVTVVTTTKVTSGSQSVTFVNTSHMGA